ncbi:MMPL family transporter [Demequina capsici]|uniref:MMPL family transporter n=1 Tax=Demequina capsici TaxID=3075620 RepID=A0AA96F8H7_9MICO|nr:MULTISPECIES: MMPL family transporter [unclassified Demequina]WNM25204.1 MMPL family transporter [Demequina sp. OYTSA14]WNM28117.1 MMPL family transporter [Demequina sp. PMTSA13]
MANLLYRLGSSSSRHPFVVIGAWIATLLIAGAAFLGFGGTLTDSFSIPGTETERVTDQLKQEIDGLDGLSARVVFQSADGSELTEAQQQEITDALNAALDTASVDSVIDPFATQAQIADQLQQISDGQAQIADAQDQIASGQEQLDAAKAQLEDGQSQLDAGQAQLDAAIQAAKANGTYEYAKDQFDAQQAQIDAQQQQIDDGLAQIQTQQDQLDASVEQLATQTEQLDLGQRLAAAASEIRTVSEDGTTALGIVHFSESAFTLAQEDKTAVIDDITAATPDDLHVYFSADLATSVEGILGFGEIAGVVLALVVLLVMMRAALPALLPIVTSVIGVGVGVATALAFSDVVEMSSVTPILGVMLGLAVGIDYSLFIVNRHRTQLRRGMDVHESVGLANGTSGNAVVFAGTTVLIALLALNVTGIPFLGVMGSVGAFAVAVAVAVAVTLTPALLGLIGLRALGRKARATVGAPEHHEKPVAPMRTWRAVLGAVGAAAVLLVIAIPALSMRLGLPDGTQEPTSSTQYQAYKITDQEFGEGLNGTLLVTADLPEAVSDDDLLAAQVSIVDALMANEDVVAVSPAGVSADNSFLAFQVIPKEGPSSESTEALVHELRALSPLDDGTVLGVAGEASGNIDISEKLASALPVYLVVVVGLSLLILIVVFRSLLVPLMATLGFVLSLFAAFGAVTAVYQWGWLGGIFGVHDPGPVLNFLPIILTGILFGLAMDYQLFLASGMRESYIHGLDARRAVVAGRRHGRAVVTAAAIIMMSVFGGFIFSHIAMIRPMGFGLAVGVLADAFVVRMLIVPALMHLAGDKAWWIPGWLDRILPNVDVEGAALERTHPVPHHVDESADGQAEEAPTA